MCRAGSSGPFWWGSSISTDHANYDGGITYGRGIKGKWREKTVSVDSFEPNPWGLYQVHGNVWEWVEDCLHDYEGASSDGSAARTADGSFRQPSRRLLVRHSTASSRGLPRQRLAGRPSQRRRLSGCQDVTASFASNQASPNLGNGS